MANEEGRGVRERPQSGILTLRQRALRQMPQLLIARMRHFNTPGCRILVKFGYPEVNVSVPSTLPRLVVAGLSGGSGKTIVGVILNQVSGARHEWVLREAIEIACGIPVLGAIPRIQETSLLPERHLGLVARTLEARSEKPEVGGEKTEVRRKSSQCNHSDPGF